MLIFVFAVNTEIDDCTGREGGGDIFLEEFRNSLETSKFGWISIMSIIYVSSYIYF